MRTITTTLYRFSELSEVAKQNAINEFRECNGNNEYWIYQDARESQSAFLREFNAEFRNRNQYSIRVNGGYARESDISDLSYVRLWKYLNTNHADCISKIGHCQFTGVCWDEVLLDGIAEFIRKPYRTDFESLLYSCCEDLRIAVEREIDYQNSDEAIEESIIANEYEFTEEGIIA